MATHATDRYYLVGAIGVTGFYVLSGYLMTLLCDGPYKGRLGAFWVSRLLRVYPSFLVTLILMVGLLWAWGALPRIYWPLWSEWLLIVRSGYPAAIPQAWAITVELFWWVAISLGISATKKRTLAWAMGGGISVALGAWPTGPIWFSVWGGCLPFAIGAMGYHYGVRLPRDGRRGAIAGALSYPIFLTHYGLGAVASVVAGISTGWQLFFAALPPTLALSWLLWRFVEVPINRFRKSLKTQES